LYTIFMDWAAIYSCGYASRIRLNRCWIPKTLDIQFSASLETTCLMQWKRGLKEFYTKNYGYLCSISGSETRFEMASACKPRGTTEHTGLQTTGNLRIGGRYSGEEFYSSLSQLLWTGFRASEYVCHWQTLVDVMT
jgi:hypothetical protein